MKKTAILIIAALVCGVAFGQQSQQQRLEKHLYFLASDSLRGREAGSADAQRAAEYIAEQWRQMGLKPLWGDKYTMPFSNPTGDFTNLVAVIEGNDPEMKNEYIVLGAHYDHVGVKNGKVYNGADDNASGSACLLEIARQLLARQSELKRSVIICAFDAEEKGLWGSNELVNTLKRKQMLDRVKLMLSIDMVGWYKANGELVLEGTGTVSEGRRLFAPDKTGVDIKVRYKPFENSLFTATDTEPFASEGIPTLAVTTGLKSPYHKPEDDPDLIDYEGLDKIADYLTALTVNASARSGKIASGRLAAKHHTNTFEAGLMAGTNTSSLQFPDAVFSGKSLFGFQGGLTMQYNLGKNKHMALRANILYDYSHCPLPAAADAYGSSYRMEQHSLLVPVMLQIAAREMGMDVHVGFGGYYGRVLQGCFYGDVPAANPAYSVNPNMAGLAWNFGMRLGGHWLIEGTWYYQMNQLFDTSGGLPKAKMHTYAVSLGYYF